MCEHKLELIKTRTLFLQEGTLSGDVVLVDAVDGDMYFRFLLKYISDDTNGSTTVYVIDEFHADITIETKPRSLTKLDSPLEIGTYQKTRTLYLDVTVEPRFEDGGKTHRVTVSFFTNKQPKSVENGAQ